MEYNLINHTFCYACGWQVNPAWNDGIFSEKKEWNNAKGMIYCQAAELEKIYFTDPYLWKDLFRLGEFASSMDIEACLTTLLGLLSCMGSTRRSILPVWNFSTHRENTW
jgi:hypothetical protein